MEAALAPITPLPKDLKKAAATLGRAEARYLVDLYYTVQEYRKAQRNQERALGESEEPHDTIAFFAAQFEGLENQIKRALDEYSNADPLGEWARAQRGVGPVIAAGLLAHIDLSLNTSVGQLWRFAGLDPTSTWSKGEKRPWNADLKVLCWKIGDSFVKVSNRDDAFYGKWYRKRKEYEVARDLRGGNADTAKRTLEQKKIKDRETRIVYESGHLPAGRLDARARRWAVKLFLAHYFETGLTLAGRDVPEPYPIAHMGHTDKIEPPPAWNV